MRVTVWYYAVSDVTLPQPPCFDIVSRYSYSPVKQNTHRKFLMEYRPFCGT